MSKTGDHGKLKAVNIFRITFMNQGRIYQLYAESVRQGEIYGLVEIAGLIFGETSSVVIDPGEEKLKNEFKGVTRRARLSSPMAKPISRPSQPPITTRAKAPKAESKQQP